MSTYLLFTDPHLADRPPSSCTDSYTSDLLVMLDEILSVAREREVSAIVCAGDFFHHKAPSRTSHKLMQAAIRWVQAAPCQVLIVPGNHDLQNDRLESIQVSQPLGVLYQAGAIRLEGWSEWPVYGVPWLGYCGEDPEQQEQQKEIVFEALAGYREMVIAPADPFLVVAHAPLYPPGQELKYEYFPAEWWADAMGMHGSVFYGHVHEPHGEYGFYDAVSGVTFCNNGALSRGSLHEYNLTRTPGATLWDDQTGKFEFIPLKTAPPPEKVFRLQEKEKVTDMNGRLDQFLAGVAETSLQVLSVESVVEHFRTQGLGKDEMDLIEELLAGAAQGKK